MVAAAAYVVWLLLTKLSPNVAAGILAALATVGVALHQRRQERKLELERQLGPEKRRVYEEFVAALLLQMLRHRLEGDAKDDDAYVDRLRVLTTQMILWAGDDVIVACSRFQEAAMKAAASVAEGQDDYSGLFAMEDVLFAMRRDLGYSCEALAQGSLLGMFINDLPAVLAAHESPSP